MNEQYQKNILLLNLKKSQQRLGCPPPIVDYILTFWPMVGVQLSKIKYVESWKVKVNANSFVMVWTESSSVCVGRIFRENCLKSYFHQEENVFKGWNARK